jgi:hypothetical protein
MKRINTDQNRKQAIAVLFRRLVPVLLAWCCDVCLTLLGQPTDYWQVSYTHAEESNVVARPLLVVGPWAFVLLALAELIIVAVCVNFTPPKLANWLAIGVTLAHTVGACAWLIKRGGWWWIGCVVLMALIAEVAGRSWRAARKTQNQTNVLSR